MPFRFDHPEYLWLLLLGVPIVWLGLRSLEAYDAARRWSAIVLRLAVLALLVAMLAGVQAVRWHSDLTVVAVLDQSESVRRFATPPPAAPGTAAVGEPQTVETWLSEWLASSTKQKKQDDRLGIVTYDARPTVRAMPSLAYDASSVAEDPVDGTDTASALRLAMALFPPDSAKRLLLVSDGNDTAATGSADAPAGALSENQLLAAAREARAAGIPIDVVPIEYKLDNEVQLEAVYAPSEAREGQTLALRVVLRATRPTRGKLYLRQDDQLIDLSPSTPSDAAAVTEDDWTRDDTTTAPTAAQAPADAAATTGRYVCVRIIQVPMARGGPTHFVAQFEPDEQAGQKLDTIAVNNRAQSFTLVHGKGRVLFVDNLGLGPGEILPNALREHGIDLDVVPPSAVPATMAQLHRYDAVLLQNVPAEAITPPQQNMLADYVNNMGGGLVMIGGADSFGAGGWTHTPIDRILPVDCEIPSQTILPSGALVIVLDRSGSMGAGVQNSSHSKQEIANEAAAQAIATLYPQDLVGVVAFDDSAKWIVRLTPNNNAASVIKQVRSIQPGGGTSIYPGLLEAYKALENIEAQDAAVKHIILLTDGQSNEGPYHKIVAEMVKRGISLSTVGVGDDVNSQLLQQLAQMAGGQYHQVTDPTKLPQVFIKEARTIRKNLIKEVPFQPALVQTGSPIMAGLSGTPPLRGLVLTGPKLDPRVFMPMLGPEGEPLFAHWQVGLGRTAAFTSDATNRWATPWLQWGGYGDFWARVVRNIARPSSSRAFDLATHVDSGRLRIRLDATSSDIDPTTGQRKTAGSFENFLDVVGTVLKPDGSSQRVTLRQTGPGIYETDMPAPDTGNYIVSLFAVDRAGGQPQAIFGGVSRPPGAELRRFASNTKLLRQIAELTGGRVLDPAAAEPAALFERQSIVPTRSVRPLWRPLMVWLLVLVLLDVAVRRIAWDVESIRQFLADRVRATRDLLKPREHEASATLAALKSRAARTEERLAAPAGLDTPAPRRDRKFEAAPEAVAADDFSGAIGAARADGSGPRVDLPTPKARTEEGATTNRLLDAKRRARERLAEKEPPT